ncbi:hypothetical protein [Hufsiella ginkgonis]|uniref:HEPN domain-containing protein n=1 Tax=Hufsiella ginkgonis TaxID=2695274 RepID=A0A7K1XTK9_9SPHI|nr:hypothetical protein [Hufsiella ginkgonis]MXV14302.1 hypothetical protein [Hufsiella ginkgonis]
MKALTKHPDTTSNKLTPKAWSQLILTADEFAYSADRYKDDNRYRHLALYLLHQATAVALTAIIRALPVRHGQAVNTREQLEAVTRFSPEIGAAFPRATAEEVRLFYLLMHAADITHAYEWQKVTENEIDVLQGWVSALIDRIEKSYKVNRKRKLKVVHEATC